MSIEDIADNVAKQRQSDTSGDDGAELVQIDGDTVLCDPADLYVAPDEYQIHSEAWLIGSTVDVRRWC